MSIATKQALAIVGIGCRYPGGVENAESFWNMVAAGTDAISDVPKDRWDSRKFFDKTDTSPGKTKVMQGGYINQSLRDFDPLFFGISPREAAFTDPQQRLLLEVLWESFEDAGITEQQLKGSNTGVFIGAFNLDNLLLQLGRDNLDKITASTAASVTMTMLSNRLSWTFDLKGPSLTLDTACSSSMVATHLACQSIWNGECDMAISGGVNIISRPEYMVSMSKGGFLSHHGRCKSFDSDAAGYVRGEGAGILIIKPLSQAQADKDDIYAVIRNTGVNQDGYTQNGISFPSSTSQQELIKRVYAEADIDPLSVSYIEAHGTGTQAGDPIEISSLASIFTPGRKPSTTCKVGSVKSNIGHTESAAGVAGIIKASLSIARGKILPNLHFNNPNPNIDFAEGRIEIPVTTQTWQESHGPRRASVNSFGYGGTNGHIILEQAPAQKPHSSEDKQALYMIPISAKGDSALKEVCQKLLDYLSTPKGAEISLNDLTYTLAKRRSLLTNRIAFIVENQQQLMEKLTAYVNSEPVPGCIEVSSENNDTNQLVFVFTGMGPQWWAMGQELYHDSPVFRSVVDECDKIFTEIAGWSIKAEMLASESESNMARTRIAQPANFIIQAALLELYKSWGVSPSAVVGHSVGEVGSAYASGALSLRDALNVVYHRSRLQQTTAGRGAMLAIGIGGDKAMALADMYDQVSVAAINSASSVTLAGNEQQLQEIAELLEQQGIFNRLLQVEVAYHSSQMDPIEQELIQVLGSIHPQQEQIPLYSTATGKRVSGLEIGADYWWQNVRQPVHFEQAIKALIDDGYNHFVEIGPHPVTRNFLSECLNDKKVSGQVIPSLVRKETEFDRIYQSLAQILFANIELTWPQAINSGRLLRLPNYPWQRSEYWNETKLSKNYLLGSDEKHPFFFERLMSPEPAWQVDINSNFFPFLLDHKISQRVVFPGAGYVEAGLALQALQRHKTGVFSLGNLQFHRMLMLDSNKAQQLRIDQSDKQFTIYSSDINSDNWQRHASGQLTDLPLVKSSTRINLSQLQQSCSKTLDIETLYQSFAKRGLGYGKHFQTIKNIRVGAKQVVAELSVTDASTDNDFDNYQVYPTLLDGAFQSLIALTDNQADAQPMVPVAIKELNFYAKPTQHCWCLGTLIDQQPGEIVCQLQLFDRNGQVLLELKGLRCTELAAESQTRDSINIDECFYQYQWQAAEPTSQEPTTELNQQEKPWLLIADSRETISWHTTQRLLSQCREQSVDVRCFDLATVNEDPDSDAWLKSAMISFTELLDTSLQQQVIYLIPANQRETIATKLVNQCVHDSLPLLALARVLSESDNSEHPLDLVLVSYGAQAVTLTETVAPGQASVASLVHLIGNELANVVPKQFDLSPHAELFESEFEQLWRDLSTPDGLEDIAFRGDLRFVKTLTSTPIDSGIEPRLVRTSAQQTALNISLTAESANHGGYQLAQPTKPQMGQLTISIESLHLATLAVSSNSKTATALAQVKAVAETSRFQAGDRVLAFFTPTSMGNSVTLHEQQCMLLPESVNNTNWALNFLNHNTALAVEQCASGQIQGRVFIQDGHTPVGRALIDVFKNHPVEIISSAPTEVERLKLQVLDIAQIVDNSDLSYVTDLLTSEQTAFSVIINSRDGEHFRHNFKLLAENGLYIQIESQNDADLNFPITGELPKNYQFRHLAVQERLTQEPELRCEYLPNWQAALKSNRFSQIATETIDASDWIGMKALAEDMQATQPVQLNFTNHAIEFERDERLNSIERHSTYLITGGTNGLGLEIARWLAAEGVKSLALLSRSASKRPEAQTFVDSSRYLGTTVQLFDVDISNAQAVQEVIDEIQTNMLPLKGIIHGAMVLDDDLTIRMTAERMRRVIEPKVAGAVNLHNATRNIELNHFVTLSSISSIIGNVGQTNYVVANAFLDSFTQYRRQLGLAATTVSLGVLQEIGVVARDSNLSDLLAAKGLRGFSTAEVLHGLGYLLNAKPGHIGMFAINWADWAQESPKSAASSRFSALVEKAKANQDIPPALVELLELLKDQEQYFARLNSILSEELARVVKMSVEDINPDRSISDFGIDSLMSVEFSRMLRNKYGFEVTSMELLSGPSLEQMAGTLTEQLTEKF